MPQEAIIDVDYLAFLKAEADGLFDDLEPGTLVAILNGVILGNAPDFETLHKLDFMQNITGEVLVQPVKTERAVL